MAKLNVTVDNGLEELELEKSDKLKPKKENKKEDKKKVSNKKETGKNKKANPKKSGSYLSEVGKEMRKVTWPSRKNVVKYSIATIFMIIALSIFFIGLSALFDLLYGLVQGWIG